MSEKASRPNDAGPSRLFGRRRLIVLAAFTLVSTWLGGFLLWDGGKATGQGAKSPPASKGAGIVSLSPGVTETIIELGAENQLVGVSDYCRTPDRLRVARVGSALTPNYESISKLSPAYIITSEVKGEQLAPLARLAPTHALPWLTLEEWTTSILELGRLVRAEERAKLFHNEVSQVLSLPEDSGGPRVLLALHYGDTGQDEIWYIKRNSVHGAALRASGARNAVNRDVTGQPKLTPEELISLDPDGIIVLNSGVRAPLDRSRDFFTRFKPLTAVANERIHVVSMQDALSIGPSVLDLVPLLKEKVDVLKEQLAEGHP